MRLRHFAAGLVLAMAVGATGCRSSSGGGLFANCGHRNQSNDVPVSYGVGAPGMCTSGPVMTSGPILVNPDGTMPMPQGGGQTIPPANIYENPGKAKPYQPEKETGRIQVKPLNEVKNSKEG